MFLGVSCRILHAIVSYLYVSFCGLITSVGEETAIFSAMVSCNYVVSVRSGFPFLLVLGKCCVINWGTHCAFHILVIILGLQRKHYAIRKNLIFPEYMIAL